MNHHPSARYLKNGWRIAVFVLALLAAGAAQAHPRGGVRFGVWVGGPLWWPGMMVPYYPYEPRPVVIQPPAEPVIVVPPSMAQQTHSWYYCRDAQMYYPYVTQCPSAWQEVPATPAK